MIWVAFGLGLLLGASSGIVTLGLCMMNRQAREGANPCANCANATTDGRQSARGVED